MNIFKFGEDARDAMLLARRLRLDDIVSVSVPSVQRKLPVTWSGPGRTSVVI